MCQREKTLSLGPTRAGIRVSGGYPGIRVSGSPNEKRLLARERDRVRARGLSEESANQRAFQCISRVPLAKERREYQTPRRTDISESAACRDNAAVDSARSRSVLLYGGWTAVIRRSVVELLRTGRCRAFLRNAHPDWYVSGPAHAWVLNR